MATFMWTEASWKKLKPLLFPNTGLTAALKKYEKAKRTLESDPLTGNLVQHYIEAAEELDKVNKLRETAIKEAGKNPLFKSAKAALGDADRSAEGAILGNFLHLKLNQLLKTIIPVLGEDVKTVQLRSKNVSTILDLFAPYAKRAIEGHWSREQCMDGMKSSFTQAERGELEEMANIGELAAGWKKLKGASIVSEIKGKRTIVQRAAPTALANWDKAFAVMETYEKVEAEYKVHKNGLMNAYTDYNKHVKSVSK